jgi:hypothetical protein
MNDDRSLHDAFEKYGHAISQKDVAGTVGFLYPKFFDIVPQKTIVSALKASYKAKDITLRDFVIDAIPFACQVEGISYAFCHISFIKVGDTDNDGTKTRKKSDKSANIVSAKIESNLLAIQENNNWFFLDIKPHVIELYTDFLPREIMDELNRLFPPDDDDESKPAKKNLVEDLSGQRNTNVVYLVGWEVDLNGDDQCERFMATQVTNKETFEYAADPGLELIYKNKKLVRVNEYFDGTVKERALKEKEVGLAYKELVPNKLFQLQENPTGRSQLGGEIPPDFKMPENNGVVPFQYLGYLSKHDPNLGWLPFDIHLVCPIYLNIGNVYLEYTNPLSPVIINKEEVESADTSYEDDVNQHSEIVFNEMKFDFVEALEFSVTGHSGIPNWIQAPDIPVCPKSGNTMKFLCQLHGGVSVKRTNVKPHNEFYRQYFEELNFWGDGDLFVFFEPGSKVACYLIQHT